MLASSDVNLNERYVKIKKMRREGKTRLAFPLIDRVPSRHRSTTAERRFLDCAESGGAGLRSRQLKPLHVSTHAAGLREGRAGARATELEPVVLLQKLLPGSSDEKTMFSRSWRNSWRGFVGAAAYFRPECWVLISYAGKTRGRRRRQRWRGGGARYHGG